MCAFNLYMLYISNPDQITKKKTDNMFNNDAVHASSKQTNETQKHNTKAIGEWTMENPSIVQSNLPYSLPNVYRI